MSMKHKKNPNCLYEKANILHLGLSISNNRGAVHWLHCLAVWTIYTYVLVWLSFFFLSFASYDGLCMLEVLGRGMYHSVLFLLFVLHIVPNEYIDLKMLPVLHNPVSTLAFRLCMCLCCSSAIFLPPPTDKERERSRVHCWALLYWPPGPNMKQMWKGRSPTTTSEQSAGGAQRIQPHPVDAIRPWTFI